MTKTKEDKIIEFLNEQENRNIEAWKEALWFGVKLISLMALLTLIASLI